MPTGGGFAAAVFSHFNGLSSTSKPTTKDILLLQFKEHR
jgi:hypothetical protein